MKIKNSARSWRLHAKIPDSVKDQWLNLVRTSEVLERKISCTYEGHVEDWKHGVEGWLVQRFEQSEESFFCDR